MKKSVKIISVICVLAMLLCAIPAMSVSASVPTFPCIMLEVESGQVKAGSEFTVDVKLYNNPGLWSLAFELDFNVSENVFEFVSASTDNSIFNLFGVCGYDETTQTYKFNGNNSDFFSNITSDGTLATLTLRVKEDAELGRHMIVAYVSEGDTVDFEGKKVELSPSTNITFEVIENKAESTIDGADVRLGDDISIKYFATVDPEHEGAQMKFTMNGKETVVDGVNNGGNKYVYVFEGVAPQCMGDNIKAELVLDGEVLAVKDGYSVLQYCKNTLAKSAAELDMTQTKLDALKTLIADLLEYGAKAQIYKGYKTNELVNKDITGASVFTELTTTVKKASATTIAGVKFTAAGVYFDYTNALFVKFTAPNMVGEDLRINFNDTTYYMLSECTLIDEATSTYIVRLDDVSVLDYGTSFNITIQDCEYDADWDEWTYTNIHRLKYSVNSYVYAMQSSENTEMADLAKALYNYGASASAFYAAN